jgi:hypothetical protein
MGHEELVDTFEKLNEDRRRLCDFLPLEAESSAEGVSKGSELLLNEKTEAMNSSKERVNDELNQC